MTRETKAKRLAREEAELAAYEAEKRAAYPMRLMSLLERASKANFELDVRDSRFVLEDRDDRRAATYLLTLEFSAESDRNLIDLEVAMEEKEEAEREAEREMLLRLAALKKLSPEERRALGV